MVCDFSTGSLRPLVPLSQRRIVFETVHGLSHLGIRAMQRLVSSRFVWTGCSADVAAWCRDCMHCTGGKVTSQKSTPPLKIQIPSRKFQHMHVDMVGPLPPAADGSMYLMTVLDPTTRWPEAFPLRGITARECADTFTAGWVARFGMPHTLTSDWGTQLFGPPAVGPACSEGGALGRCGCLSSRSGGWRAAGQFQDPAAPPPPACQLQAIPV